MKFFSRKPTTGPVQEYITATKKRPSGKTELNEVKLIALDCETSGFEIGVDVILSAAFLPIEGNALPLTKLQEWLVYQPSHRPNQATEIHGILPQESETGLTESELTEEILPILSGAILIGHHTAFDAAVINDLLKRRSKTKLRNYFIDTARMAMTEIDAFKQTGYANQHPPTLDEVCAQLNLPIVGRHTAAGDTFTTAEVFLVLSGRMRRRLGRELQIRDFTLNSL